MLLYSHWLCEDMMRCFHWLFAWWSRCFINPLIDRYIHYLMDLSSVSALFSGNLARLAQDRIHELRFAHRLVAGEGCACVCGR